MYYFVLAIFLASLIPIGATAQRPENSWENLKQIQPGHKIKVVDVKFKAWNGRLVSVSDEAIIVRREAKKEEITVERANVLRVTDLQTSHRGRNAIVGLAAGTGLGGGTCRERRRLSALGQGSHRSRFLWGSRRRDWGFFPRPATYAV